MTTTTIKIAVECTDCEKDFRTDLEKPRCPDCNGLEIAVREYDDIRQFLNAA